MEFKDYYQALGVARDAPVEEIKKAYRKLARKYHPDVSKEPDADARMKEVNEAYAVLSDPEKRAAYDQLGSGYRPGRNSARRRTGTPASSSRDADSPAPKPPTSATSSPSCSAAWAGAAGRRRSGNDHHARILLDLEDSFTGATRQVWLRVPKVDANGRVALDTRTLNVKIPKGIREGQIIRLAGQGAAAWAMASPATCCSK